MSSSSSRIVRGGVVTGGPALHGDRVASAASLLGLDLRPEGVARLDPARIDAAVEEGRARGHADGYAAGHAAGRAAAEAEAQAALAAERQAARDQVARLLAGVEAECLRAVEELRRRATEIEDHAVELALEVAEAVLEREVATAADPGADALARALALAPDGAEVVAHLHPDDARTAGVGHDGVTVVADASLDRGDCIVRTGWTTVDARLAAALDRVRIALGLGARDEDRP